MSKITKNLLTDNITKTVTEGSENTIYTITTDSTKIKLQKKIVNETTHNTTYSNLVLTGPSINFNDGYGDINLTSNYNTSDPYIVTDGGFKCSYEINIGEKNTYSQATTSYTGSDIFMYKSAHTDGCDMTMNQFTSVDQKEAHFLNVLGYTRDKKVSGSSFTNKSNPAAIITSLSRNTSKNNCVTVTDRVADKYIVVTFNSTASDFDESIFPHLQLSLNYTVGSNPNLWINFPLIALENFKDLALTESAYVFPFVRFAVNDPEVTSPVTFATDTITIKITHTEGATLGTYGKQMFTVSILMPSSHGNLLDNCTIYYKLLY